MCGLNSNDLGYGSLVGFCEYDSDNMISNPSRKSPCTSQDSTGNPSIVGFMEMSNVNEDGNIHTSMHQMEFDCASECSKCQTLMGMHTGHQNSLLK